MCFKCFLFPDYHKMKYEGLCGKSLFISMSCPVGEDEVNPSKNRQQTSKVSDISPDVGSSCE